MTKPSTTLALAAVFGILFMAGPLHAQTSFDLRFVEMLNDGVHYDVKAQIKANGAKFALGSSNFIFNYNSSSLSTPTLSAIHHFSGGVYQAMVLGGSGSTVSFNIELNNTNNGTDTVQLSYTDIGTIRFTVTDAGGNSQLVWDEGPTVVYKDDESTAIPAGTLTGLNTSPLPIQLASFTVATLGGKQVKLSWSTLSEVDNLGFDVQKSADSSSRFQTIPGSFQAGHGTTTERHDYAYVDKSPAPGGIYRLKQTDRSGAVHYSEPAGIDAATSVADREVPTEFALEQNYPNPFNPETGVRFQVPALSGVEGPGVSEAGNRDQGSGPRDVKITVYDVMGREVAVLVNERKAPGTYTVRFDGSRLASGMYIYRLTAGSFVQSRKMVLVK